MLRRCYRTASVLGVCFMLVHNCQHTVQCKFSPKTTTYARPTPQQRCCMLHSVLARQHRVVQHCVLQPLGSTRPSISSSATTLLLHPTPRFVTARPTVPRIVMTAGSATATTQATTSSKDGSISRMGASQTTQLQITQEMVDFINEAWSPFHAVGELMGGDNR